MRYSLLDQQLTTVYTLRDWPERETYVYSPLIPSPDGTRTLRSRFLTALMKTVSSPCSILMAKSTAFRLLSLRPYALIPPTSAPPPTPTPTPTETPTANPTATPTPDPVIFFDDFESETAAARRNRESDETEVRWVEWTVRMRAFYRVF